RRHRVEVSRDGFGLPALLGAQPWIRARRIDERDDRLAELLGQLHQAKRLAVSLRMRHAEVARDLLPGVAPLLMSDDDQAPIIEARQAPDDGRVVTVDAVAVQLEKILEQQGAEMARVRAAGMAGELRALPRREARVHPLALAREIGLTPGDPLPHTRGILLCAQGRDVVLDLEQLLLELKRVRHAPRR